MPEMSINLNQKNSQGWGTTKRRKRSRTEPSRGHKKQNQLIVSQYAAVEENGKNLNQVKDNSDPVRKNPHAGETRYICVSEDSNSPPPSSLEPWEALEPNLYDFENDRIQEKFQPGQFWALFCELDGLPKYYARINDIERDPVFTIHIKWLEPCPSVEEITQWSDKEIPVCYGTFELGESQVLTDTSFFSHQATVKAIGKKNKYEIYPRKGEVWALYKNFNSGWMHTDVVSCEYEMVEVLEGNNMSIKVLRLELVDAYKSVFKSQGTGESPISVEIIWVSILSFSHRVPAFRLTKERDSIPKGFWQLDSKSIPACLFCPGNIDQSQMVLSSGLEKQSEPTLSQCTTMEEKAKRSNQVKDSRRKGSDPVKKHLGVSETSYITISEDSNPSVPSSPEPWEIPDPKFYDFENDRMQEKFEAGQMWALFCELDGLPKYYALISKVETKLDFRMHIKWVEPCPLSGEITQWSDKEIPVCCGTFELGDSEVLTDTTFFSHQASAKVIARKDKYEIYPRKGEVWALYKNFNPRWTHTDLVNCEYEMVEVLEADELAILVLPLELVDGYKTVFKSQRARESSIAFKIIRINFLRFSHRVPAFQFTEERDGIGKGFWELDPKSIPTCLFHAGSIQRREKMPNSSHEEQSQPTFLKENAYTSNLVKDRCCGQSECATQTNYISVSDYADHSPTSSLEPWEIPDPQFYFFDRDRTEEKFKPGQIWALFCELDGLPKYYVFISKVVSTPNFRIQIKGVLPSSLLEDKFQWSDKDMPICCGTFELGESEIFTDLGVFSHQVSVKATGRKNKYEIYPRKGEVWALYKNFNPERKQTDAVNCEYEIVEVLEVDDLLTKVLSLELVDGFKTIFKSKVIGETRITFEVIRLDLLNFSHRVPAFRLTKECGGEWKGCWELDPKSLPASLVCSH